MTEPMQMLKKRHDRLKYEAMLLGNISLEQLHRIAPQLFIEDKPVEPVPEPKKEEPKPEVKPINKVLDDLEQEMNDYDDEYYHSLYQ